LSRTTVFACDHCPVDDDQRDRPFRRVRRDVDRPFARVEEDRGAIGIGERAVEDGRVLPRMPTASSAFGRQRLAIRAVPIATSRSRGCWRMSTRVSVSIELRWAQ